MEPLTNDNKDLNDHHENSHKLCNEMKQFGGKSMETETTTWSERPNRRKVILWQKLAEEINKSKRARL